jgi:drug/metabolite transporter (DMT)-like permease
LNKKDSLYFCLCSLFWGATWIIIKDQVNHLDPHWSVFIRFGLSALILFFAVLIRGSNFGIDIKSLKLIIPFALFQFCLNFNAVYVAETYIVSGLVAILFALLFIPNAMLSYVFFRSRYPSSFFIGSAISITGIAILFMDRLPHNLLDRDDFYLGIFFSVLALLLTSAANVLQVTKIARRIDLISLLFWSMLIATLFNGVLALAVSGLPSIELTFNLVLGLSYLTVIGTVIGFFLYIELTRSIGAAKAGYVGVIVPIIAMILSSIFEGFQWSAYSVFGSAIALGGMLFALKDKELNKG